MKTASADGTAQLLQRDRGLAIDTAQLWAGKIVLKGSNTGRLPIQINSLALDGPWAHCQLLDGATQIGQVYSTKDHRAEDAVRDIEVVGGLHHRINSYISTSDADASVFVRDGGRLSIGSWNAHHINGSRRAGVVRTGGWLTIGELILDGHGAAGSTRTQPLVLQEDTGVLQIHRIMVRGNVKNDQPLVRFSTDNAENFIDARMLNPNYTVDVPATGTGTYLTRARPTMAESGAMARRNNNGPLIFVGGTDVHAGANIELYPVANGSHAYVDAQRTIFRNQAANTTLMDLNFDLGRVWLSLPTYANNAAAVSAGLTVGQLYKTATGEIRTRV